MPAARDRMYVVLGHLDSRNSDPMDGASDAPGANDDASGVAAVMELARLFAARRCDATTVFLATTGEEQGLLGATWFVRQAGDAGWDLRAALNNDMIGDPRGREGTDHRHQVRVFSEGVPAVATAEEYFAEKPFVMMLTGPNLGCDGDCCATEVVTRGADFNAFTKVYYTPRGMPYHKIS